MYIIIIDGSLLPWKMHQEVSGERKLKAQLSQWYGIASASALKLLLNVHIILCGSGSKLFCRRKHYVARVANKCLDSVM